MMVALITCRLLDSCSYLLEASGWLLLFPAVSCTSASPGSGKSGTVSTVHPVGPQIYSKYAL